MTTAGALVALPATLRLEAAPPDLIMVDFSTNDAYEEQDWANVSRGWYGADKKKLINPLKAPLLQRPPSWLAPPSLPPLPESQHAALQGGAPRGGCDRGPAEVPARGPGGRDARRG